MADECRYCGPSETWIRLRPDTPHHSELCCKNCNRHIRWLPKEKNLEKLAKRPHYPSPEKLEIHYCQICLLPRKNLLPSETLETHHVNGNPKDTAKLNFLVVCSSCHSLINHQRTYRMRHYLKTIGIYEEWITELQSLGLEIDD